ncbi:hypothetical protein [uncultured Roseobacter sp.]|uniref:hypothetical protein n=1 Tax=uncultured Roseobacter sp. TaxID=114847 RepID=UPI0026116986|nr:hypothetical protein [uncultured Roseobacter sp.]
MPLKPDKKYVESFAKVAEELNLDRALGIKAGALKARGATEQQIDDHLHRKYGFSKDFRKRNKIATVEPS